MDILSLGMTVFGAFGAGVTVGALAFSPRLVTRTDTSGPTSQREPAVMYVVPGTPSPGAPMGPPGYQVVPAIPAEAWGIASVSPGQIPGHAPLRGGDADHGPGLPSIKSRMMTPGMTPDSREGDR